MNVPTALEPYFRQNLAPRCKNYLFREGETMKAISLVFLMVLSSCMPSSAQPTKDTPPQHPFPQHVTYAPNTIKPNHRSQAQLDDDVKAFYNHWKENYLVQEGQGLYRIAFGKPGTDNHAVTVSEGQGYGMIIVALMAGYETEAQMIFDGLWGFARAHPSDIDPRLMGFRVPSENGNDSAFDGDADMAYALLLADKQWGSDGQVNYLAEAKTLITAIRESTVGKDSKLPLLGDWAKDVADDEPYNQYSPRSSDFMPAHFRAYGEVTDSASWNSVVDATQAVIDEIQNNYSATTGLLPDFIVNTCDDGTDYCPAPEDFLEGPDDGHFYYNAGRDPMRLGTDALLNNDARSKTQAQKMSLWLESTAGSPENIRAGYTLDGTAIEDYFTSFFVAPFGVAAMLEPTQQVWLNNLYDSVYQTHEDYYEDSVTLLCLLLITGNYWSPTS